MTATTQSRRGLVDRPWKSGSHEAPRSMGVSHGQLGFNRWAVVTLEPTSRPWAPYSVGDKTLELIRAQSTLSAEFTWSNVYFTSVYHRAGLSGQKSKSRFTIARKNEAYQRMVDELNFALGTPQSPEERALLRPARILVFDTAVASLLAPNFETITEDHGVFFYNVDLHAYVIPTALLQTAWHNPVRREFSEADFNRFFTMDDPIPPSYELITELPAIPSGSTIYLDLETTGVRYFVDEITMIGFSVGDDDHVYIMDHPKSHLVIQLMNFLNSMGGRVIGHGLSFDIGMLITATRVLPTFEISDTMVEAFLLGHETKSLKHLTSLLTRRPGSHAFGGFTDLRYLAEDVLSTRDIHQVLDQPSRQIFARQLLEKLVVRYAIMRYRGVEIDEPLLRQLERDYHDRLEEKVTFLRQFKNGSEVNFNAPAQLAQFLLANGVKLTQKTEAGAYSTAEAALLLLNDPLARAILEYRGLVKDHQWLVSYIKFSEDSPMNRLHPRMNLTVARTGRLSCSDPNLQQVPRIGPVKQIFKSKFQHGFIGLVDLAQAELRVAALLSRDKDFIKILNSEDVHRAMAARVFKKPEDQITPSERKKSKGVTFGKLYGGSNAGLAQRMGIAEKEVAEVEKALFEAFPVLAETLEKLEEIGVSSGFISTPFGRIRDLRAIIATDGESSAGRKAKNTPIQSLASDIMLVISNRAQEYLESYGAKSHIIFGVHDSGLFDVHPDEIDLVAAAVARGFYELNNTPLADFEEFVDVSFSGELILGPTWAHVEDTNEAAAPDYIWACSSNSMTPTLKTTTHYRQLDQPHQAAEIDAEVLIAELRQEASDETAQTSFTTEQEQNSDE